MTLPDGFKPQSKPSNVGSDAGKKIVGGLILIGIVILISIGISSWIWDSAHDLSGGGTSNVEIDLLTCTRSATGATETGVKISNHNNFGVIVEWNTVGGMGIAKVPAKTSVNDNYYAYGPTQCGAEIESVTKVP